MKLRHWVLILMALAIGITVFRPVFGISLLLMAAVLVPILWLILYPSWKAWGVITALFTAFAYASPIYLYGTLDEYHAASASTISTLVGLGLALLVRLAQFRKDANRPRHERPDPRHVY